MIIDDIQQQLRQAEAIRTIKQVIEAYEDGTIISALPPHRAEAAEDLWREICWTIASKYKLNCQGFRKNVQAAIEAAFAALGTDN